MVTDRGLQVLRAIVQDYVDTREPVGSKAIVERHAFGVSAATIRNDMALLEDEELIAAPHTSSGRVPTDKGYRVFVDHLAALRPLTSAQRHAIALVPRRPRRPRRPPRAHRPRAHPADRPGRDRAVPVVRAGQRLARRAGAARRRADARDPRDRHRPGVAADRRSCGVDLDDDDLARMRADGLGPHRRPLRCAKASSGSPTTSPRRRRLARRHAAASAVAACRRRRARGVPAGPARHGGHARPSPAARRTSAAASTPSSRRSRSR